MHCFDIYIQLGLHVYLTAFCKSINSIPFLTASENFDKKK